MHDPFSMRPFFGYNFGDYLSHWLSLGAHTKKYNLPRIFVVNWFRKSASGGFALARLRRERPRPRLGPPAVRRLRQGGKVAHRLRSCRRRDQSGGPGRTGGHGPSLFSPKTILVG